MLRPMRKTVRQTQGKIWWHGSPSGDMRGGTTGLHLGTKQAAREALNARIGTPAKGDWSGDRIYGNTRLLGKKQFGYPGPSGYSSRHAPDTEHFPTGDAEYSGGKKIPLNVRPDLFPVRLRGPMTNTPATPHEDFKANGYMAAQLKRGTAKRGYYYENVGEDAGSISAVVPGPEHVYRDPALRPVRRFGRQSRP